MCFIIKELYLSATPKSDAVETAGNFNTDVVAVVEEEDENSGGKKTVKYVAAFFTYANVADLQSRHVKTGEYLNGKYFYAKNMVLVDDCSLENVKTIVSHLVEEGDFRDAFRKI